MTPERPTQNKFVKNKSTRALNADVRQTLGVNPVDVTVLNKTVKYNGFFKLSEYSLKHQLFNGETSQPMTREIFERGDAVVMMPYDPVNDTLVINVQFRVGAIKGDDNPWLIEFVAGMFGENESPIDVAIREAKEEANLSVKPAQIQKIMHYFSSPGGTNEIIHLYVACVDSTNVGGIYGLPEENEDILVKVVPRQKVMQWLNDGKIINAATIIALQWLEMNVQQLNVQQLKR